jgi:hypothetical protein
MSGFFEIIAILIGRILLGYTGFFVRKCWYNIRFFLFKTVKVKVTPSDFDDIIDVEDFKNRIVGGMVIVALLILAINFF